MNRHLRISMGWVVLVLVALIGTFILPQAHAASAREINASVDTALERFTQEVNGGREFLNSAKGVLVIPNVFQAGIGIGGEYGEGALRVGGRTVDYYSLMSASYGLTLGAQKKTIILVFMQDEALRSFRNSKGWKAGVDASVALITLGAGGEIDTKTIRDPIVGFVIGQKGLMYNLSLEGSKFRKLKR